MKAPAEVAGAMREKVGLWHHAVLGSGLDARNKILQKTGTVLWKTAVEIA
ncbi:MULTISPECIES: hypothetical protein [Paraburkholderia]|uniref:Uncharacterized protein n=1 Tax=Paraburkholderia madseniana TaxID=2599607 RepID=A0A6N6W1Y0_9BURK|nr:MULTISPECIES: hypothetical protein [Paraburkholderia]KAE8754251.1 hypothetical protein FSO04_40730 [Paraburkholderia madseniana]MCX4172951.1 hypothetical protein [Paraburkholderia madseniana]MDQ6460959.1 hypothetical protein [Paraburkholderia madseniana]